MRITITQLQDIIKEEYSLALRRKKSRRLTEVGAVGYNGELYDMPALDLIDFAEKYGRLGSAIQEQLRALLENPEGADVTENAVEEIRAFLGGVNSEIDGALDGWSEVHGEHGG